MSDLKREDILGADDLPREPVEVPEWGGQVYVRVLRGHERDAFELSLGVNGANSQNMRARFAAVCMCDAKGERLFNDADALDLGKKSSSALARVFDAARELNKMGAEFEEIEKKTAESSDAPVLVPAGGNARDVGSGVSTRGGGR